MAIPEYSIVIPNLHSPRIGEVLEAFRRQDGVNRSIYEILVVGRDKYGLVVSGSCIGMNLNHHGFYFSLWC